MKSQLILMLILFSTFSYSQSYFKKYMVDTSRWERKHNIHSIDNKIFTTTSYATGPIFDGFVELVLDELDQDSGNLNNRIQIPSSYKFEAYKSITDKDHIYGIGWLDGGGGFSTNDIGLYKITTYGDQFFFVRIEDENRRDIPADLTIDSQGNIFVGSTREFESGAGFTYKSVVTKVDSAGQFIWEFIDDISIASVEMRSIVSDEFGNIYALSNQDGSQDSVRLTKIDQDGNKIWTRTYQEGYLSKSQQILNLKNGNLLIAGYAFYEQYNGETSNFYMEVDKSGEVQWINDYRTDIGGVAYESNVKVLNDGRIARVYDGLGYPTLMVNKPDGEIDFIKYYFELDVRFPDDLIQMNDGSFMIVGWINVLQDPDGYTSWLMRTDSDGNLTTSIDEFSQIRSDIKLYPNPTCDYINVEFGELTNKVTALKIYNSLGQLVLSTSKVNSIDFSFFDEGLYYLVIELENNVIVSESFVKR